MQSDRSKERPSHAVSNTGDQHEVSSARPFLQDRKRPWEELYRVQKARLSRIAAKMGVPQGRIEDVLQEVWLDILKHHEGFEGEDAEQRLSAWLDIVIRTKSKDALRRMRRRREESLDDLPADTMDRKARDPADEMNATEQDQSLAAHLEKLGKAEPLNCRLVCEHILEGRSLQDLAAEAGLSINAVSCRISRLLKKLRSRLRE